MICRICGNDYPRDKSYFRKTSKEKENYSHICVNCQKVISKQRYEKNKIKILAQQKIHRAKEEVIIKRKEYDRSYKISHKEHIARYLKQYAFIHSEKLAAYRLENRDLRNFLKRQYRKDNAELYRQQIIKYRRENPEKVKLFHKNWCTKNSDKCRIYSNKRRSLKKSLPFEYTEAEWIKCKEHFENSCAYCGSKDNITQEHFVALSKGGEYTINNIIPACSRCNLSKHNKSFYEWYKKQNFFSVKRKNKILKYLNYDGVIQQLLLTV